MEEHKQIAPTKQEKHQPRTLSSHNITLQTQQKRSYNEGQTNFIEEERRANGSSAFRRQETPMAMAFPCTYG